MRHQMLHNTGWYLIPGQLKNGEETNVYSSNSLLRWDKPPNPYSMYENNRWRKYLTNVYESKNPELTLYYGGYLCQEWNKSHEEQEQLLTFEIYFMEEFKQYFNHSPIVKKQLLLEHECSTRTGDHYRSWGW